MSLVALQQLVEVSSYDVNEKSQLKRQRLLVQEFCHRKLPKVVLAARSSQGPSLEVIRANLLGSFDAALSGANLPTPAKAHVGGAQEGHPHATGSQGTHLAVCRLYQT